jgi:hypothetical protein
MHIAAANSSANTPTPSASPANAATASAAMALLQSGDAAGAARMMAQIVKSDPANGRNWRVLGQMYLRAKQADQALAAFQKAGEVEPDKAPFFKIATIYAAKGDAAQAFSFLEKAKASKRIDMSELAHDPAFTALRSDPGYKTLLPTASDFANPFIENVRIIREWDGESADDQFGWIARSIGDVNGDGVPDFVTSAPTRANEGENAGRVYVYSTKDGNLLWKVDGQAGDMLGNGIEAAGDVDHDGVGDVVAGAPGGGKAYVYSGKDGRVLHTFTAEKKEDNFGQHVAGAGDVDGDGFADVVIGAPNNNAGGKDAGRAYIYSGKDGRLIRVLTGESPGDQFGSTVSGKPDARSPLIIVGAPGAGRSKHGRVYVYDGLSPKPKFVIDADETGAALGAMFVSVVGDVDHDGQQDVYASDWSNNARGFSTGRIYVHSGKDGHRLFSLTGETAGEGFGTNPGKAGDIDGDGYDDVIVGSWQYSRVVDSGGRVCLFSGKDAKLLATYTCRTPGDTFGFDAVGMGDVDGDGIVDLLITSGWSGVHGFHSGRIFLISSGIMSQRSKDTKR